jgi:hypothetical protein
MAKKKKEKDFIDLENDRYGLFMSERSMDLEVEFARDYLKQDSPNVFTLHRVDIIQTKTDDLYGETKASEKVFRKPVKLYGMINIEKGEQEYLSNTGLVSDQSGNLVIRIYLKELEEKGVEINRGDFIGYNPSGEKERYYEVASANNVTDETEKTFAGMKPLWKKIVAIPVKGDVVPFV